MGSNQFGELGMGNGRFSSIRRGKKSNSDKPKQPQRGLGVAKLEEIRLQNQMAGYHPSLLPPFHSNLSKEDVRVEIAFTSSPSSSSNTAPSSSLFALHPNSMMDTGETERMDFPYGEFQSSPTTRSLLNHNDIFQPHHVVHRTVTQPLLEQNMEDSVRINTRHDRRHSTGSISQNNSSGAEEIDLDLKL